MMSLLGLHVHLSTAQENSASSLLAPKVAIGCGEHAQSMPTMCARGGCGAQVSRSRLQAGLCTCAEHGRALRAGNPQLRRRRVAKFCKHPSCQLRLGAARLRGAAVYCSQAIGFGSMGHYWESTSASPPPVARRLPNRYGYEAVGIHWCPRGPSLGKPCRLESLGL